MISPGMKERFPDLDVRFEKAGGEKLDEAAELACEYLEKFCE